VPIELFVRRALYKTPLRVDGTSRDKCRSILSTVQWSLRQLNEPTQFPRGAPIIRTSDERPTESSFFPTRTRALPLTYARTRSSFFIHRHLGAAAFSRAPSIVYFLSRATARADAARSRVISTPDRSKRAAIAQAFHTNDCAAAAQRGAPLPARGCPFRGLASLGSPRRRAMDARAVRVEESGGYPEWKIRCVSARVSPRNVYCSRSLSDGVRGGGREGWKTHGDIVARVDH